MKIRIKTTLIEIEIEDKPKIDSNNYTKRALPELPVCIKLAVDEAIRLHNGIVKEIKSSSLRPTIKRKKK
jgi:hypothetical protein